MPLGVDHIVAKSKKQSPIVPPGACPACLGDGGKIIYDYVAEDDIYYPSYFENCPACDGSGKVLHVNKDKLRAL